MTSSTRQISPDAWALTVKDAQAKSGLGEAMIYNLIRDGRLLSTKVGKRRLIDAASLRSLLSAGHRKAS